MITVHAQNLETFGEIISDKPFIKTMASSKTEGFAVNLPVVKTISDYDYQVKRKVQRSFRKEVGASVPKRLTTSMVDDMILSA